MHLTRRPALTFFLALSVSAGACAQGVRLVSANTDPHSTEEWHQIASHLPDPMTASPEKLEMTADVLRARRFPDDALTFYKAATMHGGDRSRLLKKEGVVHLELQNGLIARLCFQQAVHMNKKDAEAWNNLGAADFMLGNTRSAIGEYKHAVKLRRDSAVFHSNLSLAYFEAKDSRHARVELQRAFALDPEILHHSDAGGYNLQVLASAHYAEICFEMARSYAAQGDTETAITWLTKASERGFNIRSAMKGDAVLERYLDDERIKVMLANNEHLKSKQVASKGKPPSLSSAPGDGASTQAERR